VGNKSHKSIEGETTQWQIRVITKLPNSEQSYKPENCENRNDPDLVQAFLKKWWVESDLKAPKDKRTNNDQQNTTQKTKDYTTRIPLKTGGELRCQEKIEDTKVGNKKP